VFDPTLPSQLKAIQEWFGSIITMPIQRGNKLSLLTRGGMEMSKEAELYVCPGPKLKAHERIEIYHQQYWWRLIGLLHENFPTLTRLFGFEDFNEKIAVPYLTNHPPSHFALCRLGDTLPTWLKNNYTGEDKQLVVDIASIDWTANESFWIGALPPISPDFPQEHILSTPLRLQPYIHLFTFNADLFTFREAFLKNDVDYYNLHPFPEVSSGRGYFILWRDAHNCVTWEKLSLGAYSTLTLIKQGYTIQESCEKLETIDKDALLEAQEEMSLWFYKWISSGWLVIDQK